MGNYREIKAQSTIAGPGHLLIVVFFFNIRQVTFSLVLIRKRTPVPLFVPKSFPKKKLIKKSFFRIFFYFKFEKFNISKNLHKFA